MTARKTAAKKTSSKETKDTTKRIPLRITDTTLRDAHQSLWATRMRTKDIMGIIDTIDQAGFYSLEVWGGATFDVCLRFLRENPWERLRFIKSRAPKTPLQMLLRGQNVVGYKNYPDDVLDRFVELACRNGVDIFRIFDALNDVRNLEQAIRSVKRYGGHAQGAISYTISPVHTVEKYVQFAKDLQALDVDSLVIKDMAGILSPMMAEKLVSALVRETKLPIQLHTHATSGMGTATYVEGVRAGAGAIDCAISVMSGSSSQPPVETMLAIFNETSYKANLDVDCLRKMCRYFEELAPKRAAKNMPINPIDPDILLHHIPGGMISNLRSQLAQQDALDRLPEVLEELPRTRADMGYPPLVTPTSQIVGIQSVLNVLAGERYAMIPEETRNYVKGQYGQPPAKIEKTLAKKVLEKEKPITCRPADMLEPMLPNATDGVPTGLIESEEDVISYCLFPEVALEYFKWRALPTEERPDPPVVQEQQEEEKPSPSKETEVKRFLSDADYRELNDLASRVAALQLNELTIRRNDLTLSLRGEGVQTGADTAPPPPMSQPTASSTSAAAPTEQAVPTEPAPAKSGTPVPAPLNGTFYLSPGPGKPPFVKEGDTVKPGDTLCIVEAMKLFNQIKAPVGGKVVRILPQHGESVQKGQTMILID